jgi:D-xylose transport system substrate-binding protein
MKMSRVLSTLTTAVVLCATTIAYAQSVVVGVSWSNFQEERWKRDEAAMKAAIEKGGGKYISADAQGSNEKQLADVENLITRGAKVLVVLAWDADAVLPAVKKARAEGIPVIAYDRLIQDKDVFYITFDNVEVGRMQAQAVFKKKPAGNYVFIKGSATDPNADFLHKGQLEVVGAAIKAGKIKVVGEQYTEGWSPEVAQRNMEQILTKANNKVDAVVASNDGTAGGVVAALRAQNLVGIPVSGQDGDIAALNRVARGEQTVSVWKDARKLGEAAGTVAVQLGKGKKRTDIAGTTTFAGGTKKIPQTSMLLKPVPITSENLDLVIKAGWVSKAQLCRGVNAAKAPAACK